MKKKIYEPAKVGVILVIMERNIAQVNMSVRVVLDPWEEEPIPVGEDPETEGGDFYIFY